MTAMAALRETGFDPLAGTQALPNRLLDAMARPGVIVPLGELDIRLPPAPLRPACALLLAVLDREASFTVIGPDARLLREYLRFNTNAAIVPLEEAEFVLVTAPGVVDDRVRSHATADSGRVTRTIVLAPRHVSLTPMPMDVSLVLEEGEAASGPRLWVSGLLPEDFDCLADDRETPPVDVWLAAADGDLVVLPRSLRWRRER